MLIETNLYNRGENFHVWFVTHYKHLPNWLAILFKPDSSFNAACYLGNVLGKAAML